jgi:hypothetical protein
VPVTSPVDEYAVVEAFSVAEAKYNAPLNVSAVDVPRVGAVPKLWVAVINSPKNEVHIDWVFAMIFPYAICAASASNEGEVFRLTWAER